MTWPPKDWRAFTALVGSIAGAATLTAFVWWGCWMVMQSDKWTAATEADRANTVRWVLWIAVVAIGIVLVGLGMAINRRSFRASWGKARVGFEGGDEEVCDELPQPAFGKEGP